MAPNQGSGRSSAPGPVVVQTLTAQRRRSGRAGRLGRPARRRAGRRRRARAADQKKPETQNKRPRSPTRARLRPAFRSAPGSCGRRSPATGRSNTTNSNSSPKACAPWIAPTPPAPRSNASASPSRIASVSRARTQPWKSSARLALSSRGYEGLEARPARGLRCPASGPMRACPTGPPRAARSRALLHGRAAVGRLQS